MDLRMTLQLFRRPLPNLIEPALQLGRITHHDRLRVLGDVLDLDGGFPQVPVGPDILPPVRCAPVSDEAVSRVAVALVGSPGVRQLVGVEHIPARDLHRIAEGCAAQEPVIEGAREEARRGIVDGPAGSDDGPGPELDEFGREVSPKLGIAASARRSASSFTLPRWQQLMKTSSGTAGSWAIVAGFRNRPSPSTMPVTGPSLDGKSTSP